MKYALIENGKLTNKRREYPEGEQPILEGKPFLKWVPIINNKIGRTSEFEDYVEEVVINTDNVVITTTPIPSPILSTLVNSSINELKNYHSNNVKIDSNVYLDTRDEKDLNNITKLCLLAFFKQTIGDTSNITVRTANNITVELSPNNMIQAGLTVYNYFDNFYKNIYDAKDINIMTVNDADSVISNLKVNIETLSASMTGN